MNWRKSRHSGNGENTCVEVANLPTAVAVRDSKNVHGPVLTFSRDAFRAFMAEIKTH